VYKNRYETKTQAAGYKGKVCNECGIESNEIEIYEFHHIDPKDKRYNLSNLIRHKKVMDDELISELDKCILLCRNCHRILHYEDNKRYPYHILVGELKKMAVYYKGNRCFRCQKSYSHFSVYDFHHLNSEKKEHNISTLLYTRPRWVDLKPELDKCEVFCANCHHIVHHQLNKQKYKNAGVV
jgi:hypothetical protein